ncbi:MAG TPA: response regulator transcription factor [Thermoleophilaceae bacterium]|jgi:two-component system response regulator DesR
MATATTVEAGRESGGGRRFSRVRVRSESKPLRVLCVDVHEVVHWGLRTLLTAESWVERYLAAVSPEEAVGLARRYEPHVAIVDLVLGSDSGSELCSKLRAESPITRVLLMTGPGRISAHAARRVGASGVIPKDWSIHDIAGAARMVGLGMTLFAPEAQRPTGLLSPRELQVLDLIAAGATNREIAEELYLSHHTVKDHTSALYRKIRARNRAEAIQRAQLMGLLS